jgi:hypothetical protein
MSICHHQRKSFVLLATVPIRKPTNGECLNAENGVRFRSSDLRKRKGKSVYARLCGCRIHQAILSTYASHMDDQWSHESSRHKESLHRLEDAESRS